MIVRHRQKSWDLRPQNPSLQKPHNPTSLMFHIRRGPHLDGFCSRKGHVHLLFTCTCRQACTFVPASRGRTSNEVRHGPRCDPDHGFHNTQHGVERLSGVRLGMESSRSQLNGHPALSHHASIKWLPTRPVHTTVVRLLAPVGK